MSPARRFIVRGLVQGVGYRWFVARHARALGLGGSARNLADGSVEVIACGRADDIDTLEGALRRGPEFATVSSVEKADIVLEVRALNSFDIK